MKKKLIPKEKAAEYIAAENARQIKSGYFCNISVKPCKTKPEKVWFIVG